MAAMVATIVTKISVFALSNIIKMSANKLFDLLVDDIISRDWTSIFSKKSPFSYS
jgi:hypothetical protein